MTALPTAIRWEVERALTSVLGVRTGVESVSAVGGGCISQAAKVLAGGSVYFLKWNDDPPQDFFSAEAEGLNALRETEALRVPRLVEAAPGWILLEFVERGPGGLDYWQALGVGLAALHAHTSGSDHGGQDNFIGALPQANAPSVDWATFWWERRLGPQIRNAQSLGHLRGSSASFDRLRKLLPELLDPVNDEGFSLLHGDLWSGNVFPDAADHPVLVDPSTYRGHREVDLAMTELFGGFGQAFYRAYAAAWPLLPGYDTGRRDTYQLYPLLVHLNLFGASYESGVLDAIERLIG